ncbi:hypothetical protein FXE87_02760 [Vibrio mimicus]|nr:hypothetical protein FXE87_02760 [Vibrio mimicus]TXY47942.1 hypothetical protein FXE78_02085 [Vibrio mimicus]
MHSTQFNIFFMVLNQKNLFLPITRLQMRTNLNYIIDNSSHLCIRYFYELDKMAFTRKTSRHRVAV